MDRYSLKHLADSTVLGNLTALATNNRTMTADILAHIAEAEDRALYAQAGFSSMFAYCMSVLHFSEDEAGKRLYAARAARRFPALFPAVADGRLHLTAVVRLSKHLDNTNVEDLIASASHRSTAEIEQMLADRSPRPVVEDVVRPVPAAQHVLRHVPPTAAPDLAAPQKAVAAGEIPIPSSSPAGGMAVDVGAMPAMHAGGRASEGPGLDVSMTPLGRGLFAFRFTAAERVRTKWRRVQELIAANRLADVFERALDEIIEKAEKRKLAATKSPRGSRSASANPRIIPAEVRRAVRTRDGDRCAFVSDDGHRCEERSRLEFDHVVPVAQGGASTLGNVRQLCRTHNRLEAERRFGREFVRMKIQARRAAPGALAEAHH